MMTFDEFVSRVQSDLKNMIEEEGKRICIIPQNLNNGIVLTGLTIVEKDIDISPVVCLEHFYKELKSGKLYNNIVHDICTLLEEKMQTENFDLSTVVDFNKCKERIFVSLVNKEKNKELLAGIPHTTYGDLAAIYYIRLETFKDEMATVMLNNVLFHKYDIALEELHKIACENTPRVNGVKLENLMTKLAREMGGSSFLFCEEPLFILHNDVDMKGTGLILSSEIMDAIQEEVGELCYVLPSSVNELLLISMDYVLDYEVLKAMVVDTNENHLPEDEFLSNEVYVVDTKNREFMPYETYEKKQLQETQGKEIQPVGLSGVSPKTIGI